jgi:cation:H+ antiporter
MNVVFLLLALGLVTAGAEALVRGASRLALAVGLSPLVVGLTVVGFGTSAPEMGASVVATLRGESTVSVGNVIGSNIFNIGVVLGASALLRPIRVRLQELRRELLIAIAVAFVPLAALLSGGVLGVWQGVVLVTALVGYVTGALFRGRRATREARDLAAAELASAVVAPPATRRGADLIASGLLVLVGLVALVVGSRWFVDLALDLAQRAGVPELVIGLTIVAAGTSLPELVTSLVAAARGSADIAVGNVIGSNIFNLLGILGVSAMIGPQQVGQETLFWHAPVMLASTLALLPLVRTGSVISRREGGALLACYAVYIALVLVLGG